MPYSLQILLIYLAALTIVAILFYVTFREPPCVKSTELPPPARFQTHWWGYGWRPWWRRYYGLPGVN